MSKPMNKFEQFCDNTKKLCRKAFLPVAGLMMMGGTDAKAQSADQSPGPYMFSFGATFAKGDKYADKGKIKPHISWYGYIPTPAKKGSYLQQNTALIPSIRLTGNKIGDNYSASYKGGVFGGYSEASSWSQKFSTAGLTFVAGKKFQSDNDDNAAFVTIGPSITANVFLGSYDDDLARADYNAGATAVGYLPVFGGKGASLGLAFRLNFAAKTWINTGLYNGFSNRWGLATDEQVNPKVSGEVGLAYRFY